MSVRNVGGHGVTSQLAGTEHAKAKAAQPSFPAGAGMTDSQRHANSGMSAYKGGAKGRDAGAYGRPATTKKSNVPYGR